MASKIILVGFMGVGKSSVGKKLAERLGFTFIDTDTLIEKNAQTSITQLFADRGEPFFRRLEWETINILISQSEDDQVIATGGGMPTVSGFRELIASNQKCHSIYLRLGEQALFDRLKAGKAGRPLVAKLDDLELKRDIHNRLDARRPYYSLADIHINVKAKTIEAICDRIIKQLSIRNI